MLENKEGQKIPSVTFKTRNGEKWVDVSSDQLFKNKNVVVFSLPGAFTPTCSSTHLPRFNELAGVFKNHGVDDIICLSVNDTFVMNAWASDQEANNITLIPDGNGEFTAGMGMLVDKSDLGFGKRSWRYSMLVEDCIVKKMFIEPNVPGDPFEVSDADTMLNFVAPKAEKPKPVTVFSKPGCPHCKRAKELLKSKGIGFEEVILGPELTSKTLRNVTGNTTTPQIYIDEKLIGGANELESYFKK